MAEYLTEQEQLEQLKTWIKQYGLTIVTGIILALSITAGLHYWEQHKNRTLIHASHLYDEVLTLRAQNDENGVAVQAKKLITRYPNTPYAQMAALLLARNAVITKDYPAAKKQLSWVIDHAKTPAIRSIASIRMARVALTEKKPDEALALLKGSRDKSFNGLAHEAEGDAYIMLKDIAKAKAAYRLALQEFPKEEETHRPILQMKLDNLATLDDES